MFENLWWQVIISKKRNIKMSLLMLIFKIFSLFYFIGIKIKVLLYKLKILKPVEINAKVISIGNLTVGGTGKTPFTEEFAKRLIKYEKDVLIVAKGYKREKINEIDIVSDGINVLLSPKNAGDEPYMLARNVTKARVVVGSDKIKAIQFGIEKFKPDIVLLDDGFQKRFKIVGASQILLIDATNPFGMGRLFPAGMLREGLSALKDADIIVITNTNLVENPEKIEEIKKVILAKNKNAKIFESEYYAKYFYNISNKEEKHNPDLIRNKRIISISGIGNPLAFEKTLKNLGAKIAVGLRFRDHHYFREKEIKAIFKLAENTGAQFIITTEKDEVRINKKFLREGKIFVLKIGMLIKNIKEIEKKLRIIQ